jgi:hypothetical protein
MKEHERTRGRAAGENREIHAIGYHSHAEWKWAPASYAKSSTLVSRITIALYAILLMKEFESSGPGQSKGLVWATGEIFTVAICTIGVRAAELGVSFLNYFGRSPSGRSERHSQILIIKISLMITRSFLQDGYAKA